MNSIPRGLRDRSAWVHNKLVVVDVINAFTDPAYPLGSPMDDTVDTIIELLEVLRRRQDPIFFTIVMYDAPDARDGGWLVVKVPSLKLLTPDSSFGRVWSLPTGTRWSLPGPNPSIPRG